MLLRYAKLVGGLRLLISTAAPLVVSSVATVSVRTAAYVVGFGLGSILSVWFPIVLTLVSLTGVFGGATDTSICDAYRAELRAINERNAVKVAAYNLQYQAYIPLANVWSEQYLAYSNAYWEAHQNDCDGICAVDICSSPSDTFCGFLCYRCQRDLIFRHDEGAPSAPDPPPTPELETWGSSDDCGSQHTPDCPYGKKVWLQVVWGSPGGNASDAKGCFIVAYSQDSRDLPVNIEYNPFLKELFVKSRAAAYDLVKGNKLAGIDTSDWKDLDSRKGWDKGYWAAEVVDTECRGWRPGWSLKVK